MSKTVVRKMNHLKMHYRFKRSVSKSGTIQEVRKREFYENQVLNVKRNQKQHVNVNSNN